MWRLLMCAVALFAAGCGGEKHASEGMIPNGVSCEWGRVVAVTDGDTVRVDMEGGATNQPVRYIGIDTPEVAGHGTTAEPFATEAAARNTALVGGRRVCLERDVSDRDRYGRLLRYVWLEDGGMVNETLVRSGLAVVATFPPDVKHVERLTAAQTEARTAGRGLWGEP